MKCRRRIRVSRDFIYVPRISRKPEGSRGFAVVLRRKPDSSHLREVSSPHRPYSQLSSRDIGITATTNSSCPYMRVRSLNLSSWNFNAQVLQ